MVCTVPPRALLTSMHAGPRVRYLSPTVRSEGIGGKSVQFYEARYRLSQVVGQGVGPVGETAQDRP